MHIKMQSFFQGDAGNVVTTCPICGKGGTFDKLPSLSDLFVSVPGGHYHFGQRKCPNHQCSAHIFFRRSPSGQLVTFPSLRIDFNSENIPDQIKSSLEEAIICHSENCYTASAIMARDKLIGLPSPSGSGNTEAFSAKWISLPHPWPTIIMLPTAVRKMSKPIDRDISPVPFAIYFLIILGLLNQSHLRGGIMVLTTPLPYYPIL